MKTYLKYIFRQWLGDFLLAFIILNLIMIIGNIVRYSSKNGFLAVIPMIPLFLPAVFIYTLPLGGLLSTITTVSRLRKKKETVTLASSGISIIQILKPFVIIGFILSIATGICFQWLQPLADGAKLNYLANIGATLLESELKKDHAVIELGNNRIYCFKNGTKRSVILQLRKNGTIIDELFTDNANIIINREDKTIDLDMKSITRLQYNKKSQNSMRSVAKVSGMPLVKLPFEEKHKSRTSYRQMELNKMWEILNDDTKPYNKSLASYFYEKISIMLSPLFLVLAAFPLSFIGSVEAKTPGFLYGLAMVFLCYYPLLIFGKDLANKTDFIPISLCLQFPNIFLISLATIGLVKLNQKI
jgi:lipopolysaccharide export LptBFGC system permease protein LptF